MPTLLQRLAGVGGGAAAAAAAAAGGDAAGDVEEGFDLTGDDEGEPGSGGHAAAAGESESDVLQAFLAGQIDVLLLSQQQRSQGGSWAAAPGHAVRVKDEPED
jgi:hypothetical protein